MLFRSYPHETPIRGSIPFPGGALIGALLMLNLVAAKATRFRIHAKGSQLHYGLGLISIGALLACFIVAAGHSSEGLQGTPPISYESLWAAFLAGLTVMSFGLCMPAQRSRSRRSRFFRLVLQHSCLHSLATHFFLISALGIQACESSGSWQIGRAHV